MKKKIKTLQSLKIYEKLFDAEVLVELKSKDIKCGRNQDPFLIYCWKKCFQIKFSSVSS